MEKNIVKKGIRLRKRECIETSSLAESLKIGMQTRKTPNMAMAVLRFQCLGRQWGPPVILQTLYLKSPLPPFPWSAAPPPISKAVVPKYRNRNPNSIDRWIAFNFTHLDWDWEEVRKENEEVLYLSWGPVCDWPQCYHRVN